MVKTKWEMVMLRKAQFTAALFSALLASASAQGQSITIAPGTGPAGGYLGLDVFGIAPLVGLTGDGFVSVSIPSILFGGQNWTELSISENGFVALGDASIPTGLWTSTNQSFPASSFAMPILAPYWTDIDSSGGSVRAGALTDGTDSWVVIDWEEVLLPQSATRSSFQIWLGVGRDDVTYSYSAMGGTTHFTVGAQDASGTIGTDYLYNSGSIANATLQVTSSGLPVQAAVPEPATWAMMIGGFGVIGGSLRRRATKVRFA